MAAIRNGNTNGNGPLPAIPAVSSLIDEDDIFPSATAKRSTLELRNALLDVLADFEDAPSDAPIPAAAAQSSPPPLQTSTSNPPQQSAPESIPPVLQKPQKPNLPPLKTINHIVSPVRTTDSINPFYGGAPTASTATVDSAAPLPTSDTVLDDTDYLWTAPDANGIPAPAVEVKAPPSWKTEADEWEEDEEYRRLKETAPNAVPGTPVERYPNRRETDYNIFFKVGKKKEEPESARIDEISVTSPVSPATTVTLPPRKASMQGPPVTLNPRTSSMFPRSPNRLTNTTPIFTNNSNNITANSPPSYPAPRAPPSPASIVPAVPAKQSNVPIPTRHMSLLYDRPKAPPKTEPPPMPALGRSGLGRSIEEEEDEEVNMVVPGASKAQQYLETSPQRSQAPRLPAIPTTPSLHARLKSADKRFLASVIGDGAGKRNTFITKQSASYTFPLASLLRSNLPLAYFLAMLLTTRTSELLFFILDVHQFELKDFTPSSDPTLEKTARSIFKTYIAKDSALFEINVSDRARRNAFENIVLLQQLFAAAETNDPDLRDVDLYELDRRFVFSAPIAEALQLLDASYSAYLTSDFHAQMQEAIAAEEPDEHIRACFVKVLDMYYTRGTKPGGGGFAPMRERVRGFLKSRFGIDLMFGSQHVLDLLVSSHANQRDSSMAMR
ncbi:hypothetical protein BJ742DRAFT_833529 [Cladochytrium replicatum]|nr:hypothetical protein BJ742DRAFT_833529 [Cladochytrium replicatum]